MEDGGETWPKTDRQITGALYVRKYTFSNYGELYIAPTQDNIGTDEASSIFSSNEDRKIFTL